MDTLPDDLINYLSLDMDLQDVLNLCQTSKEFRDRICNNKYYWINRLKKDYEITYDSSFGNAKDLYMDTKKYLSKMGSPLNNGSYFINDVLDDAAAAGNINMIRVALMKGANVNHSEYDELNDSAEYESSYDIPISILAAVYSGQLTALKYLLPLLDRELNQEQKESLLEGASGTGGIDIVKYLTDEMGIKVTDHAISEAKTLLGEYKDDHERFKEQEEVIEHLKARM